MKINKPLKTKKAPVKVARTKALTLVKTKPTKKDTAAYYQCLCQQAQAGFTHKKVSEACHDCKHLAPSLGVQRAKELKKLTQAYQQIVGYGVFHGHRLNKDCFLCPYRGLIFMGSSVVLGSFLAYTALAMFFNYSLKLENLQKELLATVKPGMKPSDIKKLKRSKSLGDIPAAPPLPLVQEQLKEKQQEIEQLRKALEAKNTELAHTKSELDQSLEARCQALTTFGQEHEKRNKAQQELNETVEEASNEIGRGDKQNSSLRTQLFQANQQISTLQHELSLARINRNKNLPASPLEHPFNYWSYALYA
ncbi:4544_t:CDS:2 [Funneliformis geosporum]|uniref:4544_t:CDS:1 n=1 Tax=Funneliformis geosporum TaxID=1117311 RepID=A0A9W4T712_9GLOM|nr:4544_t:CDS:2 [Funneliformis geosporum]